jgi:hypothetical protein
MGQSPTKSPQKKIWRASSESPHDELSTEIEILQEQQNQVSILNKLQYVFIIFFILTYRKMTSLPIAIFPKLQ